MPLPDEAAIRRFRAPEGLSFEDGLFNSAFQEGKRASTLVSWQQSDCLVVPRRWQRHPAIGEACRASMAAGWPVVFRKSGGACVFHGRRVLCVSRLSIEEGSGRPVEMVYRRFAGRIAAAAARLGVEDIKTGSAPDAPCDGRYNVLVGKRKLAGLAMRRRQRNGMTASLVHACIWLDGAFDEPLSAINAFERRLGQPGVYKPDACVTLAKAARTDPGAGDLGQAFATAMQSDGRLICSASE